MLSKKNKSFLKANILYLIAILFMLANLILAGFIFARFKVINNEIISLNLQFIRLNNESAGVKATLDNMQSLLMRLQAQYYRSQTTENQP